MMVSAAAATHDEATGIDPTTSALIASGAALFGFCLATIRDWFRERRDRQRRQLGALKNLQREVNNNRRACSSNLTMLAVEKEELEARASKGHMTPLDRLEEGAWSLAFLDLPSDLLTDEDLMSRLDVSRGLDEKRSFRECR